MVFVAYAALAQFGYVFTLEANVSAVWMPAGVALAALLLLDWRVAPAIFFGSFVGNALAFTADGSFITALIVSLVIGSGAVTQALAGMWLVKRFAAHAESLLDSTADVLVLIFLGGALASTLNATVGTLAVIFGGYTTYSPPFIWITWWLGDTLGVLLMTPFILAWRKPPVIRGRSRVDLAFILMTLLMVALSVRLALPTYLFLLPMLVVVSWRYGMHGATLISLCLSLLIRVAVQNAIISASGTELLLIIPGFLASVAITSLVLAAALRERAIAEQKIQEYNRTLTEKISARTHEINAANAELFRQVVDRQRMLDELRRAKDTAEAASQAKSAFMASMSHELRTPLNAIIGYTEIMLAGMAGELSDEQVFYEERVLRNAQDLLTLINQVLDFSKMDAGRVEIVPQPLEVRPWLEDLVTQYLVLARAKGLAMQVNVHPAMPQEIMSDPDKLKQIAVNLLSNAIRFTQRGEISFGIYPDSPTTWVLEVRDTGVGIAPHDLDRIFEDFTQLPAPRGGKADGTGLGLAIVRRLVTLMHGEVKVTSQLGKGSAFTVRLPLVLPGADPVEEPMPDHASGTPSA